MMKQEIHAATVQTIFLNFYGNRHPVIWKRANSQMSPDSLKDHSGDNYLK